MRGGSSKMRQQRSEMRREERERGVRGGSIYGGEGRRDAWRRGQAEAAAGVRAEHVGGDMLARDFEDERGTALGRGLAIGLARSGEDLFFNNFFQRNKIIKTK